MTRTISTIGNVSRLAAVLLLVQSVCVCSLWADELLLENGMVLQGTVVDVPGLNMLTAEQNNLTDIPNRPFFMVDDGVRRYFVSTRRAEKIDYDPLSPYITFDVFQQRSGRGLGPTVIGAARLEPFDQFGRRTVTLSTNRGAVNIVQGITQLRPDWVKVEGLTHDWEHRLDTRMVPDDVLQALVEKATDQANSEDRKHAVLFYIQANKPQLAQVELDRIAADFPELAAWCIEYQQRIRELTARLGINELKLRRLSGQHQLAYFIAKQVPPDDVSADVLLDAQEIVQDYDGAVERRDRVLMLLDQYHALIPMELSRGLQGMRAQLQDELHYETIPRLDAFLRAEADVTLTPEQKLALAYSGWVLGDAQAVDELQVAQNLWSARFLVLEYLRSDNVLRREEVLTELANLEGVNVARTAQMVQQLPLPFEDPVTVTGVVREIEFSEDTARPPRRYSVMLPPEYTPQHRYPLLVVLRGEGRDYTDSIHWWAGDAQRPGWGQRRGYIVIAPHYLPEQLTEHDYSTESNAVVRDCIQHVRKRFHVDSDRIFVAGHGTGANATFDIALSAPDLFAGALTISGQIERHPVFLWENGSALAWYVVGGERDRLTLENNAPKLNRMLLKKQDVLYCDYKSRGFESYVEEQERMFEWMQTKTRAKLSETVDFELGSLRQSDHRFHWLEGNALPERLFPPLAATGPTAGVAARPFKVHIAPGGPIYIQHPGKSTTLWLSPELIDFDVRHRISINGRVVSNGFVQPATEALLEDLRQRGDRERLFWARLSY